MNEKELVRLVATASAAFFVGQIYEQAKIMRKRKAIIKKFDTPETHDFWRTIQSYLNNPSDQRTVEQLVDDWQTNIKFRKIVENEK